MTWLRHASHPRLALLLGLFSLAAGCSSDPEIATLELGSPAPGATLTSSIDEDAGADGVQVTVRGTSEGLAQGTTVNVYIDGEKLERSAKIDAEGAVAVEDVTLLPGEHSLHLRTSTGSASTDEDNRYTLRALRIVTPEDGVRLTIDADLDTGTEGLQVNVRVESWALDDGEEIALEVDGDQVATETPDDDGEVLFAGVTLGDGSHTLRAVAGAGESLTRSDEIDLEVDADCARVTFLTPEPPSSGDLLLGGDGTCPSGDDPFTIDVEVSTDVGDGQPIAILVNDRVRGSGTVDGTTAVFQDVVLDRRDSPNDIAVEVENADGITCVVPYPSEVLVDCAGPDCTLQAPEPRVVNVDGESVSFLNASMQDDGGFDVEVATSAEAVGERVRLIVDGRERDALQQDASESGSGGQADFAAVSVSDGEHTLEAQCRDAAGNVTSTGEIALTVDTQACGVSITDPADGTLFVEADDEDGASDGTQVVATSSVTGDDCAEQRAAVCDPAAGIDGTSFASYDGVDPLLSSITLDDTSRDQNLCVEIRDHAGNVGADDVAVIFRDAADAPSVLIESPTDGTRFNALGGGGYEADADRVTTNACEAEFVVACSEVGEDVELRHDSASGTLLGSAECMADSDAPAGFDGRATLTVAFGDGDQSADVVAVQRVSASSTEVLVGVSAVVTLNGDCRLPSPLLVGDPCNSSGSNQLEIQNSVDMTITVFDSANDIDTASLQVTEPDSDVQNLSPTSATSQQAVFESVDLGGLGTASIEATLTDDFDNQASASCSVEVVADLPSITSFTAPADMADLGPGDSCDPGVAGEYGVRVQADLDAQSNRTVTILVNDVAVATDVTVGAGGAIDECVVVPDNAENDPAGPSTITLQVESTIGPGQVSQMRTIDVRSIEIIDPAQGDVLQAADNCAGAGFGVPVTFLADAKHDGGSVSLGATNGGTIASIPVDVTSGRSVQIVSGCLTLAADISEEGQNTITASVDSTMVADAVDVLVVNETPTNSITIDERALPGLDDPDHRSGVVATWNQPTMDWPGQLVRYELRCRDTALSAAASPAEKEQWWDDVIDVDSGAPETLPGGLTPDDADPSARLGYRPLQPVHCVVRAFDPADNPTPINRSTNLTLRLRQQVLAAGVNDGYLGHDVAPAGDVDGDGIDDLLVGGLGEGALIWGSDAGFSGDPDVRFESTTSSLFANAVAGLGDFNGDGRDDIAVAVSGFNSYSGRVMVYFGRPRDEWPATVDIEVSSCPADLCFDSADSGARLGYALESAGDFDGDGVPDIVMASPWGNGTAGRALIIRGDAYQRRTCNDAGDCRGGVEICDVDPGADPGSQTYCQLDGQTFWGLQVETPSGDWLTSFPTTPPQVTGFLLDYGASGAYFGWRMSAFGDYDGYPGDDLMLPDNGAGDLYVLSGRSWDGGGAPLNVLSALDLGLRDQLGDPDGLPIVDGGTYYGDPAVVVGDVYDLPGGSTSGLPDLGATGYQTDGFQLYLGETGPDMGDVPFADADRLNFTAPGSNIGHSIASGVQVATGALLGDVDGDGLADLCLGSRLNQRVYFWYHDQLADSVSSGNVAPSTAHRLPIGCAVSDSTCVPEDGGTADLVVQYVGDINGDGHLDLAVGDWRAGGGRGRVILIY
jgi:hypothetical protein